mgnify:CR=1 FL=1
MDIFMGTKMNLEIFLGFSNNTILEAHHYSKIWTPLRSVNVYVNILGFHF